MAQNVIKMPLWGPYSKKYMGITRIIDKFPESGARFDFSVHPTLWNSNTPVPNVTIPSNYHLWLCKEDYSFYSYRYEMMWKDKVYADVSYSKINDEAYLLRCEYFNNTELSQSLLLNIFGALEYPKAYYCKVSKPEKCVLVSANDYIDFSYAVKRPWDEQNPDGLEKGCFCDNEFFGGRGVGDRIDNAHVHFLNLKPFGCEKNDRISLDLSSDFSFSSPVLALRYRTVTDGDAEFELNGEKIVFKHSDNLCFAYFPIDYKSDFKAELVSLGTAGIELDFAAVIESEDASRLTAEKVKYDYIPEISSENIGNGKRVSLKFSEIGETFCILTHNPKTRERTLDSGCLEDALINRLSNGDPTYDELAETFSGSFMNKKSDEGFFQNTLIHSIFIEPNSTHIEYAVLSKGKFEPLSIEEYERIYNKAKNSCPHASYNKAGEKYALSTDIMRATLLTNVVYPIYKHGENVIHHCPGKRWDCLYTWDSGFIALGLLEFSKELCEYVLNMYLSDESNRDYAFLHHGSPVPVQFCQYLELAKRSENKEQILSYYSRAKLYYDFLAGKTHGSTTKKFNNGLTTTYDYFYSSSGMDDYPAQVAMMNRKMQKYCCPCISTSHVIRAAKILKMFASALGKNEDVEIYNSDIEGFTNALNTVAWDEKSGYYSYTVYDDNNNFCGFLETQDGENLNKGMDGIYPIIAGAVIPERLDRVLSHIKNPNEMWSASGVSAVDQSAGYFMDNGYWNGNVWLSHQWFIWKTMLDLGEADFAFEIANRALEIWKKETDFSYNTYECFNIATQRGGWFHNFGGLSAPVCIWANAYYKPGTVTTGLDAWTDYQNVTEDSAEIKVKYFGNNEKYTVIVCLSDRYEYSVKVNGNEADFSERTEGCIEITLDKDFGDCIIAIEKTEERG